MNVHLCKESKRNIFCGLISMAADLDICVVTETWFKQGRANVMEIALDQDRYLWFSRERKNQRSRVCY